MNNSATMASMIEEAMQKREGGKDRFNMTGQYASPIMYDQESGREFVTYESPNGEEVKVYGNWSNYIVSKDDQGNDLIADEDFPVMKNKNGEYVLDDEGMKRNRPQGDQGMMEEAEAMEGQDMMAEAGGMEEEMPMAAGGMDMRQKLMMALGGKVYRGGGYIRPTRRMY